MLNLKYVTTEKLGIRKIGNDIIGFFQDFKFDPSITFADLVFDKDIYKEFFVDIEGDAKSDYYEVMSELKKHIENNSFFTISELERLRSFYGLTFDFDICVVEELTDSKGPDTPTIMIPLKFGFCDTDKILKDLNMVKEHYYVYNCYSMLDTTFAILHYLLWNGYKFKRCEHCGRYFATKSLKQKYCKRKSLYRDKQHLNCEEAVDSILKTLKKRKKRIYGNLSQNYPERVDEFLEEWNRLGSKTVKKSIRTLEELDKLTEKNYVKKYWYQEKPLTV